MTQDDPSDRFLNERFRLVTDTPERSYLLDESGKILAASWKIGKAEVYNMERFQYNAIVLADLVKSRKPEYILIDCRYMEFELSYQDHIWYVDQTREQWKKATIKKLALVFKDNLAVQMSMEGLSEVVREEGVASYEYRIFESNIEAVSWLKGTK